MGRASGLMVLALFALGCAQGHVPGRADAGTLDSGSIDRCPQGELFCGGACVDTESEPAHCGGCGVACPAGQVCASGICSSTCAAPAVTRCGDRCFDVRTHSAHCGSCDIACEGGKVCVDGACTDSCAPPTVVCDGSCVDTSISLLHCGGCGAACAPGASCAAGACTCPSGQILCAGACVDPSTSLTHCGASGDCSGASAGMACSAGAVCSGGSCGSTCASGTTRCGAGCTDLSRDSANCGACGTSCPAAPNALASCTASVCSIACTSGFLDCDGSTGNGCEVDPSSDAAHCGSCGDACGAGQRCSGGTCAAIPEICTNAIDDDADGLTDCADPDCAASAECTGGLCSGLVSLSSASGTLTDGSGSSTYSNGMSCAWQVSVPGATSIALDFSAFELEGCCDYVTIYEGTSSSGRQIGRFNGTSLPPRVVALGADMHVTFTTDGSITRQGFTAAYTASTAPMEFLCANGVDDDGDGDVDCADSDCSAHEACSPVRCAGTVDRSAPTGVIQDGSGSGTYWDGMSCGWRIQVPGATGIQLDFSSFELESCCDYVTVYEGTSAAARQVGRFNGTALPPRVFAAGEAMFVTFTTDSSVVRQGFTATYSIATTLPEVCTNGADEDGDALIDCADPDCATSEACTPVPCMGNVSRTAPTGRVQDGSGGGNYPNNASCSWTINVPGASSVSLSFASFALESCCDYVTVYEGTSSAGPQLGRFNGTSLPAMVTATGGAMYVTFTTDSSVTAAGFVSDYTASF